VTAPVKGEAFAAAAWSAGPFSRGGDRAASGMAAAGAGATSPPAAAPISGGSADDSGRAGPVSANLSVGGITAVNTLRREDDGRWAAINTDIDGFLAPLSAVPLEGRRASILGAGGAAAAVAVALASRGAKVTIHARRLDAAERLAAAAGVRAGEWPPAAGSWDVLVNATPAGTWPEVDVLPVPVEALAGDLASTLVYDLVYNPRETALLRAARARGAATIGGLDMLVAQAAGQWTWWTGLPVPTAAMRRAAEAWLASFEVSPLLAPSAGP
jgi:shikimate 5-dehydrogenase